MTGADGWPVLNANRPDWRKTAAGAMPSQARSTSIACANSSLERPHIGVIEPKNKFAMVFFCVEKVQKRCPGVADVNAACRRWREADDWMRHVFPKSYETAKIRLEPSKASLFVITRKGRVPDFLKAAPSLFNKYLKHRAFFQARA